MECRNCWSKIPAGAPACPRCGAKPSGRTPTEPSGVKMDAETKAQFVKYGAGAAGALALLWVLGALFGSGKPSKSEDAAIPLSVPSASPSHAEASRPAEEPAPDFPPLPVVAAAPEPGPERKAAAPPDPSVLSTKAGAVKDDGTYDGSGMKAYMESQRPR